MIVLVAENVMSSPRYSSVVRPERVDFIRVGMAIRGLSVLNHEGHLPFHKSASGAIQLDIDRPNLDHFTDVND